MWQWDQGSKVSEARTLALAVGRTAGVERLRGSEEGAAAWVTAGTRNNSKRGVVMGDAVRRFRVRCPFALPRPLHLRGRCSGRKKPIVPRTIRTLAGKLNLDAVFERDPWCWLLEQEFQTPGAGQARLCALADSHCARPPQTLRSTSP